MRDLCGDEPFFLFGVACNYRTYHFRFRLRFSKDIFINTHFHEFREQGVGPSEPFLIKNDGKYQRKILLKYKSYSDIKDVLQEIRENVNKNSSIDVIINVDPYDDY